MMFRQDLHRVAVIGCGYWGSKHARVIQGLDGVQLVIIDSDGQRVERLCRSLPGATGYTDLIAALDHIDSAVVATPPTTHASLAMTLLESGKNVLVEKPMATTVADAMAMIATAERNNAVLMAGHTFEYHSAVWKLQEMLRNDELGKIYYVDSARLNLGLYQSDVNVIFDLAPHDVSILNHILDNRPVAVHSWASRNAHPVLEDVAYLRLYYTNPDVCANVHVSWLDPCKVRRTTVVGSQKMVVYDDLAADERIRVHDKGVTPPSVDLDETQPVMTYRYGDVIAPYLWVDEPLKLEDEHFVTCAISGGQPRTDGANGLAVVEVLEAAQRSLEEDRLVTIDEPSYEPKPQPEFALASSGGSGR